MRHYNLKALQHTKAGLTDLFIITAADGIAASGSSTDNTDCTVTLATLAFGDVVRNHAICEIKTAATPIPSADCALSCSVGVTGAVAQFISAFAVITAGAAIGVETTYAPGAAVGDYAVPSGGKDLLFTFDISDADGAVADITTLEIWVWLGISRKADRSISA